MEIIRRVKDFIGEKEGDDSNYTDKNLGEVEEGDVYTLRFIVKTNGKYIWFSTSPYDSGADNLTWPIYKEHDDYDEDIHGLISDMEEDCVSGELIMYEAKLEVDEFTLGPFYKILEGERIGKWEEHKR